MIITLIRSHSFRLTNLLILQKIIRRHFVSLVFIFTLEITSAEIFKISKDFFEALSIF